MSGTGKPLVIKRYASRRLYNSETSEYVTLKEVADLIRAGRDVTIVDLKTGEDLTRQHLVQIVAEQEAQGGHVLPVSILTEVVRAYNDQAYAVFPKFLETSFEAFRDSQSRMMRDFASMASPLTALEELGKQQRAFLASFMGGAADAKAEEAAAAPPAPEPDAEKSEIDEIRKQLSALQSKLDNL